MSLMGIRQETDRQRVEEREGDGRKRRVEGGQ